MSALLHPLAVLCDDLFFAMLASESLDDGAWEDLFKRRAAIHGDALRGLTPPSAFDPTASWVLALIKDASAVCPPRWMPMRDLIESGITLNGGARGVRSLFSSKPSEKEILRVKRLGTLAVRVLGAILGADGPPSADEQLQLQTFLLSLGLPSEEENLLIATPLADISTVEVLGEIEPKIAAHMFRGAWQSALRDGLDAREEGALHTLASKLALPPKEVASLRTEAEQTTEATRLLGRSTIDALYWLLGDDVSTAHSVSNVVASLLLPDPERTSVLEALAAGAPPASVNRTTLPKAARAAALGVSWVAAMRTNPTLCRKAELAARFDTIARALEGDGPKVRAAVEGTIERALIGLVA